MKYRPKSIREVGLRAHLDATKLKHNNFDYSDFVTMVEQMVNKTNIAKAFGVHRGTVDTWIAIYKEEHREI